MEPLLSICIPSYNRPESLTTLLNSIDADPSCVEVVICEDHSPRRREIRDAVDTFRGRSSYRISYHENEKNLGYDGNLRELIRRAAGRFVMFMGDDDLFTTGQLCHFLDFLRRNPDVGYVLRAYQVLHADGGVEQFRYFEKSRLFPPGPESYAVLFRRTVTISGVTFRREYCLGNFTSRFDGTLLFQCYLLAEIALHHPSAYCDVPVATVIQTYRQDKPNFGAADAEKSRYEPGKVTPRNSVNFMKGFLDITRFIDEKYGLDSTVRVRDDLSKYSYPVLSIQRKRGVRGFLGYISMLNKEVGLNTTPYFYVYAGALLMLGEPLCDKLIILAKRALGRTPML